MANGTVMPPNFSGSTTQRQCFKTRLCYFHLQHRCARGSLCLFAHCGDEVRFPPDLSKTKICVKWKRGSCRHGSHCTYAHGFAELRPVSGAPEPLIGDAAVTAGEENLITPDANNTAAEVPRDNSALLKTDSGVRPPSCVALPPMPSAPLVDGNADELVMSRNNGFARSTPHDISELRRCPLDEQHGTHKRGTKRNAANCTQEMRIGLSGGIIDRNDQLLDVMGPICINPDGSTDLPSERCSSFERTATSHTRVKDPCLHDLPFAEMFEHEPENISSVAVRRRDVVIADTDNPDGRCGLKEEGDGLDGAADAEVQNASNKNQSDASLRFVYNQDKSCHLDDFAMKEKLPNQKTFPKRSLNNTDSKKPHIAQTVWPSGPENQNALPFPPHMCTQETDMHPMDQTSFKKIGARMSTNGTRGDNSAGDYCGMESPILGTRTYKHHEQQTRRTFYSGRRGSPGADWNRCDAHSFHYGPPIGAPQQPPPYFVPPPPPPPEPVASILPNRCSDRVISVQKVAPRAAGHSHCLPFAAMPPKMPLHPMSRHSNVSSSLHTAEGGRSDSCSSYDTTTGSSDNNSPLLPPSGRHFLQYMTPATSHRFATPADCQLDEPESNELPQQSHDRDETGSTGGFVEAHSDIPFGHNNTWPQDLCRSPTANFDVEGLQSTGKAVATAGSQTWHFSGGHSDIGKSYDDNDAIKAPQCSAGEDKTCECHMQRQLTPNADHSSGEQQKPFSNMPSSSDPIVLDSSRSTAGHPTSNRLLLLDTANLCPLFSPTMAYDVTKNERALSILSPSTACTATPLGSPFSHVPVYSLSSPPPITPSSTVSQSCLPSPLFLSHRDTTFHIPPSYASLGPAVAAAVGDCSGPQAGTKSSVAAPTHEVEEDADNPAANGCTDGRMFIVKDPVSSPVSGQLPTKLCALPVGGAMSPVSSPCVCSPKWMISLTSQDAFHQAASAELPSKFYPKLTSATGPLHLMPMSAVSGSGSFLEAITVLKCTTEDLQRAMPHQYEE